jgi:hypothetical protein
MQQFCAALHLTYPGFRKIPTESNVFIYQHKMLFPLIKNGMEKSDSRGPGAKILLFRWRADETGFRPSLKSKNYSIAQNIIYVPAGH